MSQLKVTAKFNIKPGNLEEFKSIIPQIVATVEENDPGTVAYDWHLNEQLMQCVVWEVYEDSDSVMAHTANVSEYLAQLLEIAEVSIEIYGSPSQELLEAAKDIDIRVYPFVDGL